MAMTQKEVEARRHAARRRELVERLLPVVEARLNEGGSFVNLKVEDLLGDAAVSRSTFYRYFKDKNELLLALTEPVLEDVRVAAIQPFERTAAPTLDQLQDELRRNFDLYRQHIPLLNALVEVSYSVPEIRALFERGFTEIHTTIARNIERGQRAGFIRSDVLPEETAAWITWMAERGMAQLVYSANARGRDRLAESLANLVWQTLYARDA
jgi:AcrR family transcriptional regulator